MNTNRKLLCCLAFSHVDFELATLWLRWAVYLSRQPGGFVGDQYLVILGTQCITAEQWAEVRSIVSGHPTFFR